MKRLPVEEKLDTYKAVYGYRTGDGALELMREARALIADFQFFSEFIRRSHTTSTVGLRLLPTVHGRIYGRFVESLFRYFSNPSDTLKDHQRVEDYLSVFFIARKLFDKVGVWEPKQEDVDEVLDFAEVYEYYSGEKLLDHVSDFVNCSQLIKICGERLQPRAAAGAKRSKT